MKLPSPGSATVAAPKSTPDNTRSATTDVPPAGAMPSKLIVLTGMPTAVCQATRSLNVIGEASPWATNTVEARSTRNALGNISPPVSLNATFDQEPENQLAELRRYATDRGWSGQE